MEETPLGWKREILKYLKHETLPADKGKARKIRMQASRYTSLASKLYRRWFSSPLLKCLDQEG